MSSTGHEITDLLRAWNEGRPDAANHLLDLVYDELHRQARRIFEGEPAGHTLQPTALLHEVCLRFLDAEQTRWQNRAHFFGAAARLMRQVLVDHARRRRAAKRGGGSVTVALVEVIGPGVEPEIDLLALHEALERLAAMDERQSRIVELRYFAGLTVPETAEVLGIGPATVNREWRTARAWLLQELSKG